MLTPELASEPVSPTPAMSTVVDSKAVWPQNRVVLRVLGICLAVSIGLWLIHALASVLLMLVFAIILAYLVAPMVEWSHRRGVPRGLSIGLVYLILIGSFTTAAIVLLPHLGNQISQFSRQAPIYLTTARGRAQGLHFLYKKYDVPAGVKDAINNSAENIFNMATGYLKNVLLSAFTIMRYLPWLILIPVLAFFLLKDAEEFRSIALGALPGGHLRWRGNALFSEINSTLSAYIRAQLIACTLVAVVCSIGFAIIRVPYPLVFGILAGLFEFIPLIGPISIAVLVIIVASFHSSNQALATAVFLAVLRFIEDYVIYPRIIGKGIHLHSLAIILAILSGAEIGGAAGIFLAIPAMAVLTLMYRHWIAHRGGKGLVEALLQTAAKTTLPP